MPTDEDDPKLMYIPIDRLTTPKDYHLAYVGHWWSVHPQRGAIVWTMDRGRHWFPQCNTDEGLARRLNDQLYPWAEVKYIYTAYLPVGRVYG